MLVIILLYGEIWFSLQATSRCHQERLRAWGLMLYDCHLEIFNNSIFEFVFCKAQVWWDNGECAEGGFPASNSLLFLCSECCCSLSLFRQVSPRIWMWKGSRMVCTPWHCEVGNSMLVAGNTEDLRRTLRGSHSRWLRGCCHTSSVSFHSSRSKNVISFFFFF